MSTTITPQLKSTENPRLATTQFPAIAGLLTILQVMLNESYKGLVLQWSYRFNMIAEVISLGTVFVGIVFFQGNGQVDRAMLPGSLLGFIVWFYAAAAIGNMAWGLREEMQSGTLEQMYMSPVPAGLVTLGRALAHVITTTVLLVLIAATLMLLFGIALPLRLAGLPVLLVTMVGLYGFGFVIGGATLIFKQVEMFANIISNLLLFINGAFLPVDRLPAWLEIFAKTLPTTYGIILLRRILLDGEPLAATWRDGSLAWLVLHSSVYFVGGLLIFGFCERIAKRRGSLGQY